MNKVIKYIFIIALFISGFNLFSGTAGKTEASVMLSEYAVEAAEDDSTQPRYPVQKTQVANFKDMEEAYPVDLRTPTNVNTEVEYDHKNNVYRFRTKIGDDEWMTPFILTPKEYQQYTLKKSMAEYFKEKNNEVFQKGSADDDFSLKDIKINIGPAEKIFGPGGIKLRPQGYAELSMGLRRNTINDPSLSERNRAKTIIDVNEKIQLSVNATIGDKVNFDLNYDTEATFDFDSKKIKLAYEGKEDEIVRYIEAGNVSLNTTNSLVKGASSLFGVRADLQFGKLRINTVISQQESESQSVNSKGGVQTTPFDFKADAYDENRHFFLSYYFRDNYDENMSMLPFVKSDITITRTEVWITNKRNNTEQSRNIVAFADLAENKDGVKNSAWKGSAKNGEAPKNINNDLYRTVNDAQYEGARDINQVTSVLTKGGVFMSGLDFEKVGNARLLSSSEYTINAQLGYISLTSALQTDDVLAIAYEYTQGGKTYQVGEFAASVPSSYNASDSTATANAPTGALFLKLLKPVSLSPRAYTWDLMMKNVYALGGYNLQSDRFRLNISYQNDTTGTYINYIPAGDIRDVLLLRVMNLDQLDSRKNRHPDGIFDFLEGLTVRSSDGRIFFPVVEPFGKHLWNKIVGNNPGDSVIAKKYVYQELYDTTLVAARQIAEKNKFKISGTYKAANKNEINLSAMNVAKGSVKVTAGGRTLVEGTDYTVDYVTGTVVVINQSIIDAGTPVNVSLEDQAFFSMQQKTLLGLNLSYDFSKDFTVGTTIMHMYEKPLTVKTEIGNESVKNTLWGFNTSYRTQSQWLTNIIDKLPFVNATAPSAIGFNAEFAHMIPGHYTNKYAGGYSYLDDFESTRMPISIRDPYGWFLSSTPQKFTEASKSNDVEYGKNRALLAWYTVDDLFTRKTSSLRPSHISRKDQSNHYVRRVNINELYPNRDAAYNESSSIPVLNLSFYPEERGPYNIIADQLDTEGKLTHPASKWGGITRKLSIKDFEANNIEYIEFWMMDPFIYNDSINSKGGYLHFNLGEISEDVLKDGRTFYENGLPTNGDTTLVDFTKWGKVPKRQATVYAFDNDLGEAARKKQDVGLNGLSTEEEFGFKAYKIYVDTLRRKLSPEAITRMEADPFSPLRDPAGDNYHHFRGSDYDREQKSILERYKYYNNTEGNSEKGSESYSSASRSVPDVEDIDQDYTLNETESYFEYQVPLKPNDMNIGQNYINEKREVPVTLADGNTVNVTWYQFKIPLRSEKKETVGTNTPDFKSIRYIRMYMTGFEQETHLRFGTLDLVRGEWRAYTQNLREEETGKNGSIDFFAINLEENGDKEPVNYVLPPGLSRIIDPGQPQLRQENEQALALKVTDLDPQTSRAVYKNTSYDLRRYKRMQMYAHAEALLGNETNLNKGELKVFIRLGSDYKNNYYEYEIPLTLTSPGHYTNNNPADRLLVWPKENMFDFPLELLKNVKLKRNQEKRKQGSDVSYTTPYKQDDPEKPNNKVTVMGNPSLSEVNVIMIGVRNTHYNKKSGEVWVNELRLTDFDEEGGWAAQGNLNIALSDLGAINVSGRKETAGFGSIEQSLMERRSDDYHTYSIAANINAGRFLPEKIKASIPIHYTYSNETTTPKYDPLDQDVTLSESMATVTTKAEKDSIKSLAQDKTITKSFGISGMRFDIRSKTPMPYDPANLSFTYSQSISETKNPTTVYDLTKDYKLGLNYSYSPMQKSWKPFEKSQSKAPMSKFTKALGFNYVPNNIAFNSNMSRYYTETSIRDIESYTIGGDNSKNNFLSWSQNFYWDRDFSLTWDFTKNLKASIQTGTKAEIIEPSQQAINKQLFPEYYEVWKDSVKQSIKNLGRPLTYRQTASVTYNFPFSTIPALDWATSSLKYDSNYTWDRGANVGEDYKIGNTITNNMTIASNNRFNMLTLYNKWEFLKKVNQKFSSSSRNRVQARPPAPKKFDKEITLSPDTTTTLKHSLNIKNIRVRAKRTDGRVYALKYKRVDNNTILITSQDTAQLNINIIQGKDPEDGFWYKAAQYTARGLMSVQNITVNYSRRKENNIYGFQPNIGDAFGQNQSDFGLTPGVGFAFGFDGGEDYIQKSMERNWLLQENNENKGRINLNPAIFNFTEKLDIQTQLEPIKGLKVDLRANWESADRTELQYMYDGMPRTFGGSFSMSIITISSAFESANARKGYYSEAFQRFIENRQIIADRYSKIYSDFLDPKQAAGQYANYKETMSANSSDVLVPAFLSAYTGKKANKTSLNPFPGMASMLPGWSVTYDGLINISWFKSKFKQIKLMHSYSSRYQIGSYSSYSGWINEGGGIGFISDPLNTSELPSYIPSSGYDISSVSITEQFNPLFGAEGTLNNSMTIRARYNRTRNLALNVTSFQIVESRNNDFVVGLGYRINEFNRVIGLSQKGSKGFSNDLNLNADISHKIVQSLIRKIEENYTIATSGSTVTTIKLSADYAMSKALTLRGYFDRVINTPIISASSFPTTNTSFGISIRFTLTQ